MCYLRVCLHQASASTLRQLCDNASDSVLIQINGDARKKPKPILERCRRVVEALTLTLGINVV